MRILLIVCFAASLSACGGSSTAPSEVSVGSGTNIAGTWIGTVVSSNNPTAQFRMILAQSGSQVSGSWDSATVSWSGQITGAVRGSSFDGQFTFSGTATGGTVCTGTATVVGPAAASKMTWTSASGVVGGSCPASLPVNLQIDIQRQ